MTRLRSFAAFVAIAALLSACKSGPLPAGEPQAPAGAVASAEVDSTAVGLAVLKRGGNAADAAVAAALAMAVVHPQAGNLGGGGFAVVRFDGVLDSLDFRETAPRGASRDMYLDSSGSPQREASLIGPLASGVPGTPAGLEALHRRFGRLPWLEVVEPARRLAAEGFIVSDRLARSLEDERDLLARFPETAAVWLPGGEPLRAGTRLQLPALAAALEAYGARGAEALQSGPIAAHVLAAVERHSGVMDATDLATYEAAWRPALEFDRFGWSFASMGLPSSGGYLVAGALGMAEHFGFGTSQRSRVEHAHLLSESWRRVFADRVHLGDPESTRVTPAELLAPGRIERLAAGIDRNRATSSTLVRGWPEVEPRSATESPETVHLSVIDGSGNVVALTTTLNGTFGCGLWVPGAGYFLNNEMDDFSVAPGHPNLYGLIQGPANEIAPGRRMLSSMAPTIAWKDQEIIALGGRGGSRIPTAVAQVLLNVLADGVALDEAVERPRIHHQWFPDRILAEEGALPPRTREALEQLGHTVEISQRGAKVNAARRLSDGRFEAVGDPRGPASGDVLQE